MLIPRRHIYYKLTNTTPQKSFQVHVFKCMLIFFDPFCSNTRGVISSCRCAKQGETFLDSSWRELSKLFDGSWYFSDQNPFHFEKSFKEHSEAKHLLDMRDRFLPYQNLLGAANWTTWTLVGSGWRYNHRSGINHHEKCCCILNWMDIYTIHTREIACKA